MNLALLQNAINQFKADLEKSITTSSFNGTSYPNGQKAKEALIRSSRLINLLHEVVKNSLSEELRSKNIGHTMHPPIDASKPELKVTGFIKAKKQDVVALTQSVTEEVVLEGETDKVGREASESAIVIGVRSQLSSVDKNFDTLMERAFAETLNLRLRLPRLVMGELYLIPAYEYDNEAMNRQRVSWEVKPVKIERFIKTFTAISGRKNDELDSLYKYERSCLLIVDFKRKTPKIYTSLKSLKEDGLISKNCTLDYGKLSPVNFCEDLASSFRERHSI